MEISMAASQAYALLQSQAIQKASMFSSLLQHWCAITGEPLPKWDISEQALRQWLGDLAGIAPAST
jgi:hypothetical protein